MIILIPAYEPDLRLIKLIRDLKKKCDYRIVLVDDGSGDAYRSLFDAAVRMGCVLLTHQVNEGKGQALKTGFRYIQHIGEQEGVICADCDGQHLPADIIRVAEAVKNHRGCVVLGIRRFIGQVPFRSRFGNSVTRMVFSFVSGLKIYDTQTGLRGYSADMLKWLCDIPGKRFEYEMNMLLEAGPCGYGLREVNINTVYLNDNKSSHFQPLRDSVRIYWPIIKFSMSSIVSAVLDFVLLAILQILTANLLLSVAVARLGSAAVNYSLNNAYVFSRQRSSPVNKSLPRYAVLAIVIMLVNYEIIYAYHEVIGMPVVLAKIFTEATLFSFSFWSQRKFVFNLKRPSVKRASVKRSSRL
ncbi:Glycosyl transferase family 2 [Paenibacillus sophorae]|uniref:Bifunctional glycosyltransferase family 2/GtrA family protein n=1 Tax=Paenibacillus sophorae TaxID=1333845 RepID=A0A1H8MPH1_9BACL|nr:bifunctional glycosyltransferase family 2/GtrA family protein [Paenibacillus sophorae]QWU17891.1 bifunctional glycosyltransferase family 2/GtrA family protein [Paenibacillus sophorae]SEO19124.1 Glycosyl transferase family 2 [Paenibacillus sophorae]